MRGSHAACGRPALPRHKGQPQTSGDGRRAGCVYTHLLARHTLGKVDLLRREAQVELNGGDLGAQLLHCHARTHASALSPAHPWHAPTGTGNARPRVCVVRAGSYLNGYIGKLRLRGGEPQRGQHHPAHHHHHPRSSSSKATNEASASAHPRTFWTRQAGRQRQSSDPAAPCARVAPRPAHTRHRLECYILYTVYTTGTAVGYSSLHSPQCLQCSTRSTANPGL